MDTRELIRIVLLPFPPTPLAAFAYFLYRKFNKLAPKHWVCYHYRPRSIYAQEYLSTESVLKLFGSGLYDRLRDLAKEAPKEQRYLLKRMFDFCRSNRGDIQKIQELLYRSWQTPQAAAENAFVYFQACLQKNIDPFQHTLPRLPLTSSAECRIETAWPCSQLWMTLPVTSGEADERSVIAHRRIVFKEEQIWQLPGQHLGIVIGGPSGSGKSTLTATLVDEMNNVIRSL